MRTVRLGDICDVVSGGTPSRSKSEFWQDGTIPWIKIGNIKGKHVFIDISRFPNELFCPNL